MATYKLHYGTQAAFDAKKAAGTLVQDDLYFTSDTLNIYKGGNLMSAAVEAVTEFPATGAQGRIYVNTDTLEAKTWDGSAWATVSPAVETTLTAETATGALVTAGAIRAYVAAQTGTEGIVQNVVYDKATQKITVTYADGSTNDMLLENLVTDASYDAATGTFTFTKANGDATTFSTPVENFLKEADYDAATHILTLTMESGSTVTVNLEDLIDAYTVEDTDSVDLELTANNIKANVKISSAAGNVLELKTGNEAGLYVTLADYVTTAAFEEDLALKADKATTYTKTEVDGFVDAKADKATTYTKTEVDGFVNAKADAATTYTKTEVDGLVNVKANTADVYAKTETYTQEEVNAAINAAVEAATTWQEI